MYSTTWATTDGRPSQFFCFIQVKTRCKAVKPVQVFEESNQKWNNVWWMKNHWNMELEKNQTCHELRQKDAYKKINQSDKDNQSTG